VDFEVGSRFAVPGETGEHPVRDRVAKTYRHLNFFQHECEFEVHYREQLREILTPKQPNVGRALLNRWCTNVMRSKVAAMRDVAEMVLKVNSAISTDHCAGGL
jgi:hypothetical protein